jgi:hypothetical protein
VLDGLDGRAPDVPSKRRANAGNRCGGGSTGTGLTRRAGQEHLDIQPAVSTELEMLLLESCNLVATPDLAQLHARDGTH